MSKIILSYLLILTVTFGVNQIGHAHVKSVDTDNPSDKNTEEIVIDLAEVYPNPAVDYLFIKFQNNVAFEADLEIRSVIGNQLKVAHNVESNNLIKVDVTQIPAGHYYAILTINGEKTLKKFIKKAS